MLKEEEILRFMEEDRLSEKKRFASIGKKYYDGMHDIRNYRLFYYNTDGCLVEDKSRLLIKQFNICCPGKTDMQNQMIRNFKNSLICISITMVLLMQNYMPY